MRILDNLTKGATVVLRVPRGRARHRLAAGIAAIIVLAGCLLAPGEHAAAAAPSPWRLVYSTNFPVDAPLGSFSRCRAAAYKCAGLPAALRAQWWAYPDGWPDTATQLHLRVGGYYSPSTTVWIANHVMNIRMWRGAGHVHSAALLPRASLSRTYGKYVETFRVVDPVAGYKSAHMLWHLAMPADGSAHEVDFPECGWGADINAFIHFARSQAGFYTAMHLGRTWHTSRIEWTPTRLSLYLDGKLIGSTTRGVPHLPMRWVLQNETQLTGTFPPVHSSSTMQIKHVAYYSWTG